MFASVAVRSERVPAAPSSSSVRAAVAVAVTTPAAAPDSSRASSRTTTLSASRNSAVETAMVAIAASRSGRRPAWSEKVASVSNARIVPTVYAAKINVVVSAPKPSLGAHSV